MGATAKVTVDIETRLVNMQQTLSQLQNATSKLNIDKDTAGRLKDIETRINTIRNDLSKEVTNKTGFNAYFKELNAIITDTNNITKALAGGFDKILTAEEVKNIQTATSALEQMNSKTQKQIEAEQKLANAQKNRAEAEEKLNKAKIKNQGVDYATERDAAYKSKDEASGKLKEAKKDRTRLTNDLAKSSVQKDPNKLAAKQQELAKVNKSIDEFNAKIKESERLIIEYQEKLASLKLGKGFKGTKEETTVLENSLKKAKQSENGYRLNVTKANKAAELNQYEALRVAGQSLNIDMSGFKAGDVSQINALADAIIRARTALQDSGSANDQAKQKTEELQQATKGATESVNQSAEAFEKQNEALADVQAVAKRIQYFFSLQNTINLVTKAVKSAFNTIKELDQAMTETAIVTNFSVGDMWDKLPEYTTEANKLGVSVKSLYESTTLYYQQGLNSAQAMQLSTETMKMARIAGLDAADATDRMTNALRAFNMELNQDSAQRVNDVYSKVAAISASNVDELSTAMTKVASLASNVGMSFEQTTSYLATGIETTRESADSIGTALKTVLARFAEIKKDPTLQEAVDGETVDVNKVESALRSVGIALRDSNGEFRSMGDVFGELNQKWDSLSNSQQRYIATMAAGSRQQSRFIAMMSNATRTTELYDAAVNSAGASEAQYNKTLESLETKLTNLKNAWETFLMGVSNNEFIKGFVDAITKILNSLNKLTEGFSSSGKSIANTIMMIGGLLTGKGLLSRIGSSIGQSLGLQNVKSHYSTIGTIIRGSTGNLKKGEILSSGFVNTINSFGRLMGAKDKDGNPIDLIGSKRLVQVSEPALTNLEKGAWKAEQEARQKVMERAKANESLADINKRGDASGAKAKEYYIKQHQNDTNANEAVVQSSEKVKDNTAESAENLKEADNNSKSLANNLNKSKKTGSYFNVQWKETLKSMGKALALSIAIQGATRLAASIVEKIKNGTSEGKLNNINKIITNINTNLTSTTTIMGNLSNITTVLDEYTTKMSELTVGSAEWNATLAESNQQVLQLAQQCESLEIIMDNTGKLSISQASLEKTQELYTDANQNYLNALNLAKIDKAELEVQILEDSSRKSAAKNGISVESSGRYITAAEEIIKNGYTTSNASTVEEIALINDIVVQLKEQTALEKSTLKTIATTIVNKKYDTLSQEQQNLVTNILATKGQQRNLLNDDIINGITASFDAAAEAANNWKMVGKGAQAVGGAAAAAGLGVGSSGIGAIPGAAIAIAGGVVAGFGAAAEYMIAPAVAARYRSKAVKEAIAEGMAPEGMEYDAANKAVTYLGETIEDSQAEYLIQQEYISNTLEKISENIADFVQTSLNTSQAITLNAILNGERSDFTKEFALGLSDQNIDEVVKKYFNGMNMSELDAQFGLDSGTIQKMIITSLQTEFNYQRNAISTAIETAMRSGRSATELDIIAKLDIDSVDALNNLTDSVEKAGEEGLTALYKSLDFSKLATDDAVDMLSWLEQASFDNPIAAFDAIQDGLESSNTLIKNFAKEYKNITGDNISASSQINYLLSSDTYSDLYTELEKIYKKNKQISSTDVKSLAESFNDLDKILINNNISAGEFASILNAITKDGKEFVTITDNMIKAITKYSTSISKLGKMQDDIDVFGEKESSFTGMDFLAEQYDSLSKEVEFGAYGSNAVVSFLNWAFDTSDLQNAVKSFDQNEYKSFIESKMTMLKTMTENNGREFWMNYAKDTENQINGFSAKVIDDITVEFSDIYLTYNDVLEQLQKQFGISESVANMMMESLLAYDPIMAEQLNTNSFNSAIVDLLNNTTGEIKIFTQQELESFGALYNKTTDDITNAFDKYLKGTEYRVIDYSQFTADSITKAGITGAKNRTKSFTANNITYYDPDKLAETLVSMGVDATQVTDIIDAAVKENYIKIGKTLSTYDENGNKVDYVVSENTVADVNAKYNSAVGAADYQAQAKVYVSELEQTSIAHNLDRITALLSNIAKEDNDTYKSNYNAFVAEKKLETDYGKMLAFGEQSEFTGNDIRDYIDTYNNLTGANLDYNTLLNSVASTYIGKDGELTIGNDKLHELMAGELNLRSTDFLDSTRGKQIAKEWNIEEQEYKDFFFDKNGNPTDYAFSAREVDWNWENGTKGITDAVDDFAEKVDDLNIDVSSESKSTAYAVAQVDLFNTSVDNLEWAGMSNEEHAEIEKLSEEAAKKGQYYNEKGELVDSPTTKVKFGGTENGGSDSTDRIERQYDWLYNVLQKITKLEQQRSLAQKQLNLYLSMSLTKYEAIAEAMQTQQANLKSEIKYQEDVIAGRRKQYTQLMDEAKNRIIYGASDANGKQEDITIDLTQFAKIVDDRVEIEYDKIIEAVKDPNWGSERSTAIQEYIGNLETIVNDIRSAAESIVDNQQQLLDNITSGESTYTSLVNEIADALKDIEQQVVDKLSRTNENLSELNNDIVNSLENNIKTLRQQRENEETETDLAQLRRRIAYLQQDTTGANKKQLLELQKQLTQDTRSYQDKIADQTLEELKDSNAIAQEQRQEQIDLLQAQIDYNEANGVYHKQAEDMLIKCFNADNELKTSNVKAIYEVMSQSSSWKGLTDSEIGLKQKEMQTQLGTLVTWATAMETSFARLITIVSDVKTYLARTETVLGQGRTAATSATYEPSSATVKVAQTVDKTATKQGLHKVEQSWVGKDMYTQADVGKYYYNTEDQLWAKSGWVKIGNDYSYFDENGWRVESGIINGYEIKNGIATGTYYDEDELAQMDNDSLGAAPEAELEPNQSGKDYTPGWNSDSTGWWYAKTKDEYYANGVRSIGAVGSYYWFDEDGYIVDAVGVNDNGKPKPMNITQLKAFLKEKGYNSYGQVKFESGGLADFTGPAWLDGTQSKPELVLNSTDTQNFLLLNESLRELLNNTKSAGTQATNSCYNFDVDINVDQLADDYDVNKLAQQVQQQITDTMRYRNVVAIGIRK